MANFTASNKRHDGFSLEFDCYYWFELSESYHLIAAWQCQP